LRGDLPAKIVSSVVKRWFFWHFLRRRTPSEDFSETNTCVDPLQIGQFIEQKTRSIYFVDLLPLQPHFLRERLLGEFGFDFQSPLIFALRAQYASPFAVPGRMRSPPSLALPACPNLTVFFLPVSGFVITFLNRFSIARAILAFLAVFGYKYLRCCIVVILQ